MFLGKFCIQCTQILSRFTPQEICGNCLTSPMAQGEKKFFPPFPSEPAPSSVVPAIISALLCWHCKAKPESLRPEKCLECKALTPPVIPLCWYCKSKQPHLRPENCLGCKAVKKQS